MLKERVRSSDVLRVGVRKDEGVCGYEGVTHNHVFGEYLRLCVPRRINITTPN
jgi:hypothetical protein